MPINTRIIDTAKGTKARVSDDGALIVTTVPASAALLAELGVTINETGKKRIQYLNGEMGSDGFDSGITSMNVDGSTVPQKFYIGSNPDYDIVVTTMVISVIDGAVSLSKFGALAALTNGVDFVLYESGTPTPIITSAKTGGELLSQTGALHVFGAGASVNIISSFSGNNDALIIPIKFEDFLPEGLRITKGSLDEIYVTINDNLLGLVDMNIRLMGYKVF